MKTKLGRPKLPPSDLRVAVRIRLPLRKLDKIHLLVAKARYKNITQVIEHAVDAFVGYD